MSEKLIVGIDPGLSGGIAVLGPDIPPVVIDIPVVAVGKRREVSPVELATFLSSLGKDVHVFIERVGVMPGQGVASSGSFMRGFGITEGVVAGLGLPYSLVPPQRWKASMMDGQGKDKDASRARAMQLFPSLVRDLGRKRDDGRAEALLIAEYGRRILGGGNHGK